MWHSGQVSQKQHNNQRTPIQQNHSFAQQDAAAAASSSASWVRPILPAGSSGSAAGSQQYAHSGGMLLPTSFAVLSPAQLSIASLHQQATQLATSIPQQQQMLPHQHLSIQGQPVQQPWTVSQAWAVQQPQPQLAQHIQQQRPLQQQQQQLVVQQQRQLQQQQQQHPAQTPLPHPAGGRGWGGQRLPYPRPGGQITDNYAGVPAGRGRGRGVGGPDAGRGWRGGPGGAGRGGAVGGPAGGHSDAMVQQLFMVIRQLPAGQAPQDAVAGRLAAMDGRSVAMLLKQLANNGLAMLAWELFDWLRSLESSHELVRLLDVFLYTAMISLCSSNRRDMDVALALNREMVARGVPRNVHTFSALMNVCIKAGQHQAALDVWRELQEAGCQPNVVTYNTLIDAYGKTGQWAEALKVLARMKDEGMDPVTRTYNTLMIACNSSNQWHEALAVYNQMLTTGHAPNTTTYNALITVYSKAGRLDKVMETFQEMEAAGCERTVITYSALISACERDGQWELALQMFNQMLREGCIPNIITYNSLITALAAGSQWERAADVFVQLQRQGCEPDVVTYTALINAYEKGGQWRRALQAFDRMLQQGCRTDHVVFSAVVDALWDSGVTVAQYRAARIHCAAMVTGFVKPITTTAAVLATTPAAAAASAASGGAGPSAVPSRPPGVYSAEVATAYPSAAGPAASEAGGMSEVRELHLASMATGSAIVAFLAFLADLRERVIDVGPDAALPPRVILRFSRSRGSREGATTLPLRDVLHNWLQTRRSPFKLVQDGVAAVVQRLEAPGPAMAAWLLEDPVAVALLPYTRSSTAGAMAGAVRDPLVAAMEGFDDEVVRDAELEVSCRDAFEKIRRFEATHCLSVAAMGIAYHSRRRELATNLLRVAATLQLPRDVTHDAVLLLDRLMSAAPQLREDLFPMAAVTALRILAVSAATGQQVRLVPGDTDDTSGLRGNGGGGSSEEVEAELDARLAQVTGLPTLGFQSMELNIHSALVGDTAAISALRCLRLYMHRLGTEMEVQEAEDIQDRVGPSLQVLIDQAVRDSEFLNYRPSATAAAALYCHRLRRGQTPFWPAAVASLTGYADLQHPELAAAVGAVQRLIMELSAANASGVASSIRAVGGGGSSGTATAQMATLIGSN
ncbi:hypothetical protein Vafri_4883 [Volvox africanus]|uniref:Pentacotripeptide-repeat region of PRORP domain-containing protein n=1 Tax=Volvox africanus TaxID=51714 RepID=A0A8J4AUJ9_9CHLO|nr:hypothetical protein Vafri_4883 [Volvox africanus]